MAFSKNQFIFTSKDYYKKVFFHRFRNFKSFKDQLDELNESSPDGTSYEYNGTMIPDGAGETFDFRHLLFEYFFSSRSSVDVDAELGIGFDFTAEERETGEVNALPDFEVLKWIPFNDVTINSYANAEDETNSIFALKDNKVSLKTYPSLVNTFNGDVTLNTNWLKFFRVNKAAQLQIINNYKLLTEPITEFYTYLSDLDNPFPVEVTSNKYVTTKKVETTVTNYDETTLKDTGKGSFSEINFMDSGFNNSVDGEPKTVESAWQIKDIQGRKVIGICKSDDENNIVHERHTDGSLYAVNIPSENIFRDATTDDIPTVENVVIDLTNNVQVKGEMMPPLSYYGKTDYSEVDLNRDGSLSNDDLDDILNMTSVDYAKQQINTNVAAAVSVMTPSEKLTFVLEHYIGKMLVMGKTNIKGIPYDPTRAIAHGGGEIFNDFADAEGFVPMDVIAHDLQARMDAYKAVGGLGIESQTYPWSVDGITPNYGLYQKIKIDTDWYAGKVVDADIYEEDDKWKLNLTLETVSLDMIKNYTSPLGWIYGESRLANDVYANYGEANTLSKYMTSFRFFDLSVMETFTNNESDILRPDFHFASTDVFGAHCPTLSRSFFNNISNFINQRYNIMSVYDYAVPDYDYPVDDFSVYFGAYAGEGLWQKGLEIILDCNFTSLPSFTKLFKDLSIDDYFVFNSIQRTASEFDFTNQNLPISNESTSPYNRFNNEQDNSYLIQPAHLMFIPYEWNQQREAKWLREYIYAIDYNSSELSNMDPVRYKDIYDNFKCTILYQEDNGDNVYVKDFYDSNFNHVIDRMVDGTETPGLGIDFLYLWRPVRHLINQCDTDYIGNNGTSFNHEFVYTNEVDETDETGKTTYRMSDPLSITYVEDPNALDNLLKKKQSTGTFYYELENNSIRLILPTHDLYAYTILDPSTSLPTYFFQAGDKVCIGFKGIFENKTSSEIISATAEEITTNSSLAWNNKFRGILTEYNKSQSVLGDTLFHSAPVLENTKGKNLLAPYADMWIKLGDVNDVNYSGGFAITNHNYIIPAEWSLGGMIITGKQWKNNIDYSYTYNDPSVVHFFLTEDSDIRNSISVTSVNNIRKQFDDSMLYLGSVIIPSEGYFNLSESLLNLSESKENAFDIIKASQLTEMSELETSLIETQNENSRENLDGMIFSGLGYFSQMAQLDIQTDADKTMYTNLKIGQTVSQNGIVLGEIIKKIDSLYTIVIKLYSAQNIINKDVPINFSIL